MDIAGMHTPYGWAIRYNLLHDFSWDALGHYALGAVVAATLIGGISFIQNRRPDRVLPLVAERTVNIYGRVMDIHIVGDRDMPVCLGSRIKRRLVLLQDNIKDLNRPEYVMNISDDNVVAFREGALDTHLIVELPAAPRPGLNWQYQPTPIDACSWWARFFPWFHNIKLDQGPLIPVSVSTDPARDIGQRLPFTPIPRASVAAPEPSGSTPFLLDKP